MKTIMAAIVAAVVLLPVATVTSADAGWNGSKGRYSKSRTVARSGRRRSPQVRGFRARRGGYSYAPEDVVNTYGDGRTRYGSNNAYRDPFIDRQTNAGPFDHGFFFDSAIAPRGGDSPYMQ